MAEFLNVDDSLESLALQESMVAAEFGCGSAAFTVHLAKKLKRGKVYALDIQEEKLSALRGRISREHINNIATILCDLEAPKGSTLHNQALDVVVIPNVLFQVENKYGIMEEAKRVLKSGGQLLILDWLKKSSFSPKEGLVTPEEVKLIANQLALSLKKEFATGDYHYGLLFEK